LISKQLPRKECRYLLCGLLLAFRAESADVVGRDVVDAPDGLTSSFPQSLGKTHMVEELFCCQKLLTKKEVCRKGVVIVEPQGVLCLVCCENRFDLLFFCSWVGRHGRGRSDTRSQCVHPSEGCHTRDKSYRGLLGSCKGSSMAFFSNPFVSSCSDMVAVH